MGVKGLWPVSSTHQCLTVHTSCHTDSILTPLTDHQIISAAAEEQNLLNLTVNQGFHRAKGVQAYRLRVDIRYVLLSSILSFPCHSDLPFLQHLVRRTTASKSYPSHCCIRTEYSPAAVFLASRTASLAPSTRSLCL